MEELLKNLREAIEGWLAVDVPIGGTDKQKVVEIAI